MNTRYGPSGETRTRGILLPKQARYQLRYTWKYLAHYTRTGKKMQLENVETLLCISRYILCQNKAKCDKGK